MTDNVQAKEPNKLKEMLKLLYGMAAGGVTFGPIMGLMANHIIPPYLQEVMPYVAISISIIVLLILSLILFVCSPGCVKRVALCLALPIALLSGLLYAYLLTNYVGAFSDGERFVIGTWLTADARDAIDNKRVENTPRELLAAFGEESPDLIWENRCIVNFAFLMTFCGTVAGTAATLCLLAFANLFPLGLP